MSSGCSNDLCALRIAVGRRGSCDCTFGNNVSCFHLHLCARGNSNESAGSGGSHVRFSSKSACPFDGADFQLRFPLPLMAVGTAGLVAEGACSWGISSSGCSAELEQQRLHFRVPVSLTAVACWVWMFVCPAL